MGMLTWINGRLSKRSFVSKLYISSQATLLAEATNNVGIYSLLKDSERSLLQEQRVLVKRARELTQAVGLSQAPYFSTSKLDESVFTVVIAGEFNSGKSTLINALVGSRLLEVGNLPTTDCITILSHQLQDDSHFPEQDQKHIPGVLRYSVNLPLLQDMNLVDTPGTNALTNHTARTLNLLPKADCILFVTSADRPFPESERKVIESIQQYRKNIIM
jgi:predicted GTPase